MRKKMVRPLSLLVIIVLLFGCLVGCGAEKKSGKKEQSAAATDKKDKDSKTEPSADKETEEVVDENAEEQKEEEGQGEQPSNEGSKQPSSNQGNSSDKNSGSSNNSKTPSSTKTVSFNRDRLYNMMVATYKVPNYVKEVTKSEFAHEVKGQIPAKVQKVFDWYFAIMDGGNETMITVSDEEYNLYMQTASQVFNFTSHVSCGDNRNGTKTLMVTSQTIDQDVQKAYDSYCNQVKAANEPNKKQYEGYLAEVKKDCDLIEKAVNSMNIKGKDEVTAINAIINYICKNCTYGQGKAEGSHSLHTGHAGEWITDCLESHKAVCNGYAKTFYAMCYYAGIDVTYYWGHTDTGEVHAWDSVKIGGKDYYFDVTWQDALQERGSSKQTYVWAEQTTFGKEHIKDGTDIKFW